MLYTPMEIIFKLSHIAYKHVEECCLPICYLPTFILNRNTLMFCFYKRISDTLTFFFVKAPLCIQHQTITVKDRRLDFLKLADNGRSSEDLGTLHYATFTVLITGLNYRALCLLLLSNQNFIT